MNTDEAEIWEGNYFPFRANLSSIGDTSPSCSEADRAEHVVFGWRNGGSGREADRVRIL